MIVLHTNVVSELMNPVCNSAVEQWLDTQAAETLYLTSTSLSELLLGIELLPAGKRKESLRTILDDIAERLLEGRILDFDQSAARCYSRLVERARRRGRAISVLDGQIAAVAESLGFTVATRDTSPFEAAGVAFVNPWET